MLRNYLVIFFRNLVRNKTISFINLVGLTVGMTSCFLILLYVAFELSFEDHHEQVDHIYRLKMDLFEDGSKIIGVPKVAPVLGPVLKQKLPGVNEFSRLFPLAFHSPVVLTYTDDSNQKKSFEEAKIFSADPSIARIFTLPMVQGDLESGLNSPSKLLISESASEKYFGKSNPIGKLIKMRYGNAFNANLMITGVFKDIPENSHLKFDLLVSNQLLYDIWGGVQNVEQNWEASLFYTYLLLSSEADAELVQSQLPSFVNQYQSDIYGDSKKLEYSLQPLSQIHLRSNLSQEAEGNGSVNQIRVLTVVAIFILILAWINYANLYTAWVVKRAAEVGIRKSAGATSRQVIRQFLLESFMTYCIAFLFTSLAVVALLPLFRQLTGKPLFVELISPSLLLVFISLFAIGIFISSIYPALVLSSFQPMHTLKGKIDSIGSGVLFRKGLLVLQFSVSVALIIGTLIILNQLKFLNEQDIGVSTVNKIVIKGPIPDSLYLDKITSFKTELLRNPQVGNVTASSTVPGQSFAGHHGVRIKGKAISDDKVIFKAWVDYDFMSTYDMELIAGRLFSNEFGSESESLIINEAAVNLFGFSSPQEAINELMVGLPKQGTIVGVVKNHYHNSFKKAPDPMVFMVTNSVFGYNTIKLALDGNHYDSEPILTEIKTKWEELFPESPFNYFYLDEFFDAQYQDEAQFGQAFTIFASLSIILACLGLFGLSLFDTELRAKEIGVRMVLGASMRSMLLLFSKDFIAIVLLGNLIAWPVIYLIMKHWLSGFVVKAPIDWMLFPIAGLVVLFVAFFTVGYNIVMASRVNPVNLLRED